MVFAEIEQAIAGRLAPLRDLGIAVRALPSQPAEWGKLENNGIITIKWEQDDPASPDNLNLVFQKVIATWCLDIRLRNLREASGAWNVVELITALLLGFKPPHCQRLYLRSREFLGQTEGIWVLEIKFAAETYVMQAENVDGEPALPIARTIVFENSYGDLLIGEEL